MTPASSVTPDESDRWSATIHTWGDQSADLAMPLPLEIQSALQLDENSVVTGKWVNGRLVLAKVNTDPSHQTHPA